MVYHKRIEGGIGVICPVCNQQTTALVVGKSSYCKECGARLGAAKSMDIRPSRPEQSKSATMSAGTSAHSLHARVKPTGAGVLDLRAAKPIKASEAKAKATPGHTSSHTPGHWVGESQTEIDQATVSTHHAAPVPPSPPSASAQERHLAHFEDRFQHAKSISKSQHISKFHGAPTPAGVASSHEQSHHAVLAADSRMAEMPGNTVTQHEALAKLANLQQAAHVHDPSWRPNLNLAPRTSQYLAMAGVVAVMGGYIWLQNYPKMAIQSASSKAGITASMPGYVPSSYTLANTHTGPGLVTLDFSSPSQPGKLTISQHRTTWDSVSLLDQYINGKSPDYTAVEGQGLTVYLYGQNQATWVNHGIWYNIEGATRLSRDQILKIAYSL